MRRFLSHVKNVARFDIHVHFQDVSWISNQVIAYCRIEFCWGCNLEVEHLLTIKVIVFFVKKNVPTCPTVHAVLLYSVPRFASSCKQHL